MNIISKINQKLLERFPSIWNTKIVWILLLATVIHLIFFFIGFVAHLRPESLQKSYVTEDFFTSGLILANIIISILILVGWLVYMFKNNSFKNFYPTSRLKLFGQFFQYFIIVFVSTTFYYSYMFGFKTVIYSKYDDAKMQKQIELVNSVYPFLTFEPNDYLITEKQYPEIFTKLYCETDPSKIDYTKKFYQYYNSYYQFNNLYAVTVTKRDSLQRFIYPERENINNIPLAYIDEQDAKCIFYFKKDVADVSDYIKDAKLNFGNFSKVLYTFGSGNSNNYYYRGYDDYSIKNNEDKYTLFGIEQNKKVVELLQRANREEFKKMFNEFLKLSDAYKINHNLTDEIWVNLVFNPPTFEVENFIYKFDPSYNSYSEGPDYVEEEYAIDVATATIAEGNTLENPLITERREFIKNRTTPNFYEIDSLKQLLENVDEVKNLTLLGESISFFLWFAFSFSVLVFSFRVTNLRALLFAMITAGVISLISALFFVGISFALSDNIFFGVLYYGIILGTLIIMIPVFAPNFGSKLFRSILINISIVGFPFYVLAIISTIALHQEKRCDEINRYSKEYVPCNTIIDAMGVGFWSLCVLICSLIFIFFYVSVIKKWKASPE